MTRITDRGLKDFDMIIVFNWPKSDEVENLKWHSKLKYEYSQAVNNIVAIFKVKKK